ncbi:hypothetical protein K501DRAFT_168225 [Backusella circina FSU 941]|nr:hypothetical protein K501DRAFT_168225 [Backusella circina FSU 941]
MVSQQIFDMIDLKITVYGLEEYNQLPKGTPVGVMFACPGMGQTQKHLEKLCVSLCSLNNSKKQIGSRYIMAATVDQPHQGTRARDGEKIRLPKGGLYDQPHFGIECHTNVMNTALYFTCLIDVFETCVFGTNTVGLVDKWGVIGFSMGGYSALQAAASGK